ncbi:hypothetical protein OA5_11170 [Vibrio cyclitrophicus 1F111]|nr:hypothetical protein [Vibrio cyclitrophicus]OEF50304.1 hypothetical protein OAC_03580 [Vibrio cyclitrophicus 1F273]OEF80622.1 hypothetical protein OA5_11170 [Vibrio cyclitrophicus 1F111]PME09366.1 hypothetical protein BCV42_08395 [Vibrio cyclitrophicus]PME39838.1 hypothetical protein BCV37_02470 [Vibrio cyclitrophicus]
MLAFFISVYKPVFKLPIAKELHSVIIKGELTLNLVDYFTKPYPDVNTISVLIAKMEQARP